VVTQNGTIVAEHVVNAAGLWAREVAAMAGVRFPIVPMEHQYFVTESIPEVEALDRELPSISDRDAEYYLRQEGKGFLLGTYEHDGKHWAEDRTPWEFGHELLPDDLERIAENVATAMGRMPVLETAGIKKVINGPMVWSFDGTGLLGPVPSLRNYHAACGIMTGISQGGGLGKCVAEWIVEGEPEWDMRGADVARFGDYIRPEHVLERSYELYGTRFRMHFPYEEIESARPIRVRDNFQDQVRQGAVFTSSWGWETPLYFASRMNEREPGWSYRRTNWFEPTGRECRALRDGVGIIDVSPYSKLVISGRRAASWLDTLTTNRLPEPGRLGLAPMVNDKGRFVADFSISRLEENRFLLMGGGSAELYYWRLLQDRMPTDGIDIVSWSEAKSGFAVTGPESRNFLAAMSPDDVSNEAFPFMRVREIECAGVPALALRVSFTGELGYEIYFDAEHMSHVYAELMRAAKEKGAVFAGGLALNALRIEKSYGSWFSEFTPDYDPISAGLCRFVDLSKPHFIGKDALEKLEAKGTDYTLATLEVEVDDADAFGGEAIIRDGEIVGDVTSGSYGHTVGKSLALGYIRSDALDPSADYAVTVIGSPTSARLLNGPAYDPKGQRLRA